MKSDPVLEKLKARLEYDKDLFIKTQEMNKYLEIDTYKFRNFPFYLWVAGFIIFVTAIFSSYLIFFDQHPQERTYTKTFLNLLFYYLSFYIIYIGKVEIVEINRKKGILTYRKINIFLSKREKVESFDNIEHCEIIKKGRKKGTDDHRKYFIRIKLKNNEEKIEFGYTWEISSIRIKYQICLAMIKGIILAEVANNLIKDESTYHDYIY